MELLAPAGNAAAFRAALAAGADAIYCGLGSDFNARRGADNFDDETFRTLAREAHLAGSRVYVTVNVVIQQRELPAALALVERAWLLGADGVIVQDWGLMALIAQELPEVEVHVSTQAAIQDPRGADWCQRFGVSRVTLARELSLSEIRAVVEACDRWGAEVECFCHGAICFCYSGLCMMSAMRGDRSANRGLCAQPCRLPHILEDGQGKVLSPDRQERALCPKDARFVHHLKEMVEAGVTAFKIEGRMKAPDYVWAVVGAYRQALDAVLAGEAMTEEGEEAVERRLARAFNRDFTDAYLMGRSDNDLMSYGRSNNRGQLAGEVVRCRADEVTIACEEPVGKGDLLELRPVDEPDQFLTLVSPRDVPAGGVLRCPIQRFVRPGTPMRVLRSQEALDGASRIQNQDHVRRRPVTMEVRCVLGEPLTITATTADGAFSATATGAVVEAARTRPLDEEAIATHVGRMGATAFEARSMAVTLEGECGMGFSSLHHLRDDALAKLEEAILAPYAARRPRKRPDGPVELAASSSFGEKPPVDGTDGICVLVPDAALGQVALAAGAQRVYLGGDGLAELVARGEDLGPMVPWLDEICRQPDHDRIDPWISGDAPCAVGNVSELALAAHRDALAEVRGCIPVHNRAARDTLVEAGAMGFWLSPELSLVQMGAVAEGSPVPMGVMVHGRVRTMTSEHCVLQVAGRCIHDCARCTLRAQDLHLRNVDGLELPVRTDLQGRSRIYWARTTDLVPEVGRLKERGISRFLIDATFLSAPELEREVARLVEALERAREGKAPLARERGCDRGHLDGGVK